MICVEIWNKGRSSCGKHDVFTGTHKLKICTLVRCCVFRLYWFDENFNSNTQTLGLIKDEEKKSCLLPSFVLSCAHSREVHALHTKICLWCKHHLASFTSGALWVCSFITLSLLIGNNELNWPSLSFALAANHLCVLRDPFPNVTLRRLRSLVV